MSPTHVILLVEKDEQSAQDIQRFLKAGTSGFNISYTPDISQGLDYLRKRAPSLVLLGESLLSEQGFNAFKEQTASGKIPVILLSDLSGDELKKKTAEAGAVEAIVKNKINLFHLQKTIEGVLRLNETVNKLDTQYSEIATRHETYSQLLNKLDAGVLVLNSSNTILFANEKAYSIMAEEAIRTQLAAQLQYRPTDTEESVELQMRNQMAVHIRISNLDWNGERATSFFLERKQSKPTKENRILEDEMLQTVINTIGENVLLLKEDKILLANKAALNKLKWKPEQISGKKLQDILSSKEEVSTDTSINSFFQEKETEGDLTFSDGSTKPAKYFIRPVNLSDGYYQLLSFSIIEDKPEQTVPKGSSGDERLSSENLLHLASHDLREPVRTILNYLQLISDKIGSQKYEEATEFAAFAKTAAFGMDRLLSDLKVYTSLNDHHFSLTKISMKQLMGDVMKQIKTPADAAEAEISFGELPDINADRQLVEKLLFHLIDNAIKFRRKEKKPVIDIGYDKFEGNIIFCVRDNGIGISKKHYQKIFELFERLNRVEEFPGNGLGLAICKKIIEMHGGEIWVESLPGSGSNFYFTLKSK